MKCHTPAEREAVREALTILIDKLGTEHSKIFTRQFRDITYPSYYAKTQYSKAEVREMLIKATSCAPTNLGRSTVEGIADRILNNSPPRQLCVIVDGVVWEPHACGWCTLRNGNAWLATDSEAAMLNLLAEYQEL